MHLDSAKTFVQLAKRNVELSGLSDRPVRWIVEDCMTFLNREIRRRQNATSSGKTEVEKGDHHSNFFGIGKGSEKGGKKRPHELPGGYDGLIFDPPAFGRGGSKGKIKTWQIEKDLPILFDMIPMLLSADPVFILISCHDDRWPAERFV